MDIGRREEKRGEERRREREERRRERERERERDIYIYIYIMLLCSIMGCFFSPNAFENAPGHAFENGVRSVRGREIPIFTMFRGYRQGSS